MLDYTSDTESLQKTFKCSLTLQSICLKELVVQEWFERFIWTFLNVIFLGGMTFNKGPESSYMLSVLTTRPSDILCGCFSSEMISQLIKWSINRKLIGNNFHATIE